MEPYQSLTYSELLDALAEYTALYTKLLTEKNESQAEFLGCRVVIDDLMSEIELRKKNQTTLSADRAGE